MSLICYGMGGSDEDGEIAVCLQEEVIEVDIEIIPQIEIEISEEVIEVELKQTETIEVEIEEQNIEVENGN